MDYNLEINMIKLEKFQHLLNELFFQIKESSISYCPNLSFILKTLIIAYNEINLTLTFNEERLLKAHILKALLALNATKKSIADWKMELESMGQTDSLLDDIIEKCTTIENILHSE